MEKLVKLSPVDQAPKNGEVVCWCPDLGWRTLCYSSGCGWVNASDTSLSNYEPTHFIDLSGFETSLP